MSHNAALRVPGPPHARRRAGRAGGWPLARQASEDHRESRESPESTEPMLATDRAQNAEAAEPTEPTDIDLGPRA